MRIADAEKFHFAMRAALETLWRRKWLLVQVVLLGGLVGALIALGQPRRYEATGGAFPDGAKTHATNSSGTATPDELRNSVQFARSARVLDIVLNDDSARGLTPRSLLDRSRVTVGGSGVLEFQVTDASPARATALATDYARAFVTVRAAPTDAPRSSDLVIPAGAAHQVSPQPAQTIALGLLLGAIGAAFLILALDAVDRRVHNVVDVGKALALPLLGSAHAPKRAADGISVRGNPYSEEAEAYRILRANLELATVDPGIRVIMVTGAVDGEGRTSTIANLAVACALGGRRVALVDLHLRYPAVGRLFDLEGRPGFTDVVLGHVPLASALERIELAPDQFAGRPPLCVPGELDVLPAGPEPVDTAEVVGSGAAASVLDALCADHDLVLVDAPPLLPVVDARMLSTVADAMIVVTNLRLLRRPMLRELKQAVLACSAVPLGFVATGFESSQHNPYGRYYYERRPRAALREWAA
jgi:Mrp family chromosome partitioning ATPase/capsular polysaccharide biosynthesis protein